MYSVYSCIWVLLSLAISSIYSISASVGCCVVWLVNLWSHYVARFTPSAKKNTSLKRKQQFDIGISTFSRQLEIVLRFVYVQNIACFTRGFVWWTWQRVCVLCVVQSTCNTIKRRDAMRTLKSLIYSLGVKDQSPVKKWGHLK